MNRNSLVRTPESYPYNHEPEIERPLTGWRMVGAVALGLVVMAVMIATGLLAVAGGL